MQKQFVKNSERTLFTSNLKNIIMENNQIKTISAFEYIILSVADPESLKDFKKQTESERLEERKKKLKEVSSKLRIKTTDKP